MDFLKLFSNHTEYEAYKNSGMILPNVSHCVKESELHFNDSIDQHKVITYTATEKLAEGDSMLTPGIHTNAFNTTIKKHTFKNGEGTITFVDDVTTVGDYAFFMATQLTGIELPESVTSIGNSAFGNCYNLASIDIPDSVTSIGSVVFNQTSITDIEIPSGVTSIGIGAFYGCDSLSSVTVDSNNTVYDSRNNSNAIIETDTNTLISGCKNTVIPNTVTTIGQNAFTNCSGLTSIDIPSSVTSIAENAFYGCSDVVSITIDSNNPIYDSRDNCNAIIKTSTNELIVGCKNTVIPSTVTAIGNGAFGECGDLTSIDMPSGLTSIGQNAFFDCSGLTSVTIPSGVTSIGGYAFYQCSGLTEITVNRTTPPTLGEDAFNNTNNCPIYVPASSVNTYKTASSWGLYASRIYAIGSNVITYSASTQLAEVVYPSDGGVHTTAFDATIVSHTFDNGTGTIKFNRPVTNIGTYAFTLSTGMTRVTIPRSVTRIGVNAFGSCSGLTNMSIPNGVTTVDVATFAGCKGLISVYIPNTVTAINQEAFQGCSSLTSVTIPNSVTSIDINAFSGCSSITRVNIGSGVTSINHGAFYDCSSLASIEIPSGVTSIGDGVFRGCSGLKYIMADRTTPTSIGPTTFDNANNCPIYVPDASVNAYKTAQYWSTYSSRIMSQECIVEYNYYYNPLTGITEICDNASIIVQEEGINGSSIGRFVLSNPPANIKNFGGTAITSIKIPSTVTKINAYTFQNCTILNGVVVPDGVTEIGWLAFAGCTNMQSMRIEATTPPSITEVYPGADGPSTTFGGSFQIYVPTASLSAYKTAWSTIEDRIVGY